MIDNNLREWWYVPAVLSLTIVYAILWVSNNRCWLFHKKFWVPSGKLGRNLRWQVPGAWHPQSRTVWCPRCRHYLATTQDGKRPDWID